MRPHLNRWGIHGAKISVKRNRQRLRFALVLMSNDNPGCYLVGQTTLQMSMQARKKWP